MSKRIDVYHHEGAGGGGPVELLIALLSEKAPLGVLAGMILTPIAAFAYIWFVWNADFLSRLFVTLFALPFVSLLGGFIGAIISLIFNREVKQEVIVRKYEDIVVSTRNDPVQRQQKVAELERKYGAERIKEVRAHELTDVPWMAADPFDPTFEYSMTVEQRCDPDIVIIWRRLGKPIAKKSWSARY